MLLANPTVSGYTLVSEWGGCVRFDESEPVAWQLDFGALCDVEAHRERAVVVSIDGSVRDFQSGEVLCGPDTPQQHRAALLPSGNGGAVIGRDGRVRTWGDVADVGSLANLGVPYSSVADILVAPDGQGYTVLASDGGVFSFGTAIFAGSLVGERDIKAISFLQNEGEDGYRIVTERGDIWTCSDDKPQRTYRAPTHFGARAAVTLPGGGTYIVSRDGLVFPIGGVPWFGSHYAETSDTAVIGLIPSYSRVMDRVNS